MDAVIEGLHCETDVIVTRVNPQRQDALEQIAALAPDAVIMEPQAQSGGFALALLRQGFPIIGLDIAESTMTVFAGQRFSAASMADLAGVIQEMGGGI